MRLIVRKDGELIIATEITANEIRLGRSLNNDIVLSEEGISRHHARILKQDQELMVEDLQSPNGTLLNGQVIDKATIKPGDRVVMGPFELSIEGSFEEPLPVLRTFLQDTTEAADSEADPLNSQSSRLVRLDGVHRGETQSIGEASITLSPLSRIEKTDAGVILKDPAETTHTFVDGVPVRERLLENHDIIEVGEAQYEYLEGNSKSNAEPKNVRERRPRMSEDASFVKPTLLKTLADWRIRAGVGFIIGLSLVFFFSQNNKPKQTRTSPKEVDSEAIRLTRLHLARAESLLSENKFDEAEARLQFVLDDLAPGNPDAKNLMEKITRTRSFEKKDENKKLAVEKERSLQIKALLQKADRLMEGKKFSEALALYQRALSVDDQNRFVQAALASFREEEERFRREKAAKQKSGRELERLYKSGIVRFESGDIKGAIPLLTEVASRKGHRYQSSARAILSEIQIKSRRKIDEQIRESNSLIESGDLLQAYDGLSRIVSTFPKQEQAAQLLQSLEKTMATKAKQAYTEGITYQELAEDPASALEKYQEALRYSPNPKSEYHQKAKKKLDELKSASQEAPKNGSFSTNP